VWYPSWVTFVNYSTLLILKWKPFFKLILIFHFILSLPLKRLIFTITISWWSKSNNLNVLEIVNLLFIVFVMHLMHTIWRGFFVQVSCATLLYQNSIPELSVQQIHSNHPDAVSEKMSVYKKVSIIVNNFYKNVFYRIEMDLSNSLALIF
jgi:hypothetical protein